jgi:psp operon transcriptional activator
VGAPDLSEAETLDFIKHIQAYEIDVLKQAMKRSQFNQRKAAEFLQMSYHQLRGYLRKYDLLG